jgi:geranylgeranyl pyrophosphate synthase
VTLPVIIYLARFPGAGPVRAVVAGDRSAQRVDAAIEAICASGAVDLALEEAKGYARRSAQALDGLPAGKALDLLGNIAVLGVERRR